MSELSPFRHSDLLPSDTRRAGRAITHDGLGVEMPLHLPDAPTGPSEPMADQLSAENERPGSFRCRVITRVGCSNVALLVVVRAHLSNPSDVFLALAPGVVEARLLPPAPPPALPARVRTFAPSVEQQLLIIGRYEGGATMAEIAAELDCSRKRIMRVLHEAGVQTSRPSLRPDQLEDICLLYVDGWSLAEIGRKYGCAHTTVRDFMMANGIGLRPRRGWTYS